MNRSPNIKNKIYIPILILLLLLSISSCWNKNKEKQISGNTIDFSYLLDQQDTLKINASFDEYGEWGGHTEKLWIYYFNQELYGEFIRDTVENKKELLDTIPQKIVEQKLFKISDNDKKVITVFLDSILFYSLKEQNISHAGRLYEVNSENVYIRFYDYYRANWKPYHNLKTIIFKNKSEKLPTYVNKDFQLKLFRFENGQNNIISYSLLLNNNATMWIDNVENTSNIFIETKGDAIINEADVNYKNLVISTDTSYTQKEKPNLKKYEYIHIEVKGELYFPIKGIKEISQIKNIYFEADTNKKPYKLVVNSTKESGRIYMMSQEDIQNRNMPIIFIVGNNIKRVKFIK